LIYAIWEAAPGLSSKITRLNMPSFKRTYSIRGSFRPIEPPKWIIIGVALWLVGEFCAFALVVSFFGLAGALLLGLATTVIGFSLLRQLGRDAAFSLRQVFEKPGRAVKSETLVDGGFAAIGATLLILPGFLSDFVGLALSAPSIRLWLANRFKGHKTEPRRKHQPREQVIDLGAQEWRRIDDAASDLRGHR
jgi:UPF0716 protein FxsA